MHTRNFRQHIIQRILRLCFVDACISFVEAMHLSEEMYEKRDTGNITEP